jgi:MFS family permease
MQDSEEKAANPEPSDAAKRPLPRNVRLLGFTSLLNDTASEMIYPLLPDFLLSVLGGNRAQLGVIEGVAETTASLIKLWSGGRSDRAGRRKGFVVFGYGLAVLSRPLIGLVTGPWQLFGLRIADRIGKGVRTAPRDALIADATDSTNRGRAFGFHRGMDHLGAAIGPALATAFLWFFPDQLRTLFLWSLLPGLAVLVLVVLGLREEKQATADGEKPVTLSYRAFDRNFWLFLGALLLFTLGNSSDAFLLVRAEELGVPRYLLPTLWGVFHIAKSSGNVVAGRAVDRFGPRPMIFLGWALYAAVYLLFALATSAWHVWLLFLAYAVFYALTEPAEKTLVANLVGKERKGLAYGWFNLTLGIGALPASILFGVLYQQFGAYAAFGLGAVLALLASALLAFIQASPTTVRN